MPISEREREREMNGDVALTSSLFLWKLFLFTENGTFWDFKHYRFKMIRNLQLIRIASPNIVHRKLYAYQVNNLICILQFLIDGHTSEE
jgi:hypothetical protein